MKIIGLTGPIASGKNEVCRILRRRGAYIIDVDKLGHRLLSQLNHNLNRHLLANIVFKDKSKLRELEKIIHPSMVREVNKELLRVKGQGSRTKKSLVIINAAILRRMKLDKLCDEVWVVLAKKEIRLKRLLKKGLTKKEALARMRAQPSDKEYRQIADMVIINDGRFKELRETIRTNF